jgi:hypothetical protein
MPKQADIFGGKPRKPYQFKMHVCDAGGDNEEHIATFECRRCNEKTGWLSFKTITEIRRGIPCPICNNKERK